MVFVDIFKNLSRYRFVKIILLDHESNYVGSDNDITKIFNIFFTIFTIFF